MRTDVGTWRDGQLAAKPKYNDIPDPLDPEWKVQVFIKNQHGRIVPATKWVAQDMINNYGSRVSLVTEADYYAQEEAWDDKPIKASTMIRSEELEKKEESVETPIKVEKNEMIEKLDNLNQKFDQLTDAILQLAKSPKGKKGKK